MARKTQHVSTRPVHYVLKPLWELTILTIKRKLLKNRAGRWKTSKTELIQDFLVRR